MPCDKNTDPPPFPPVCLPISASRRILQNIAIQDLAQDSVICGPASQTPSNSVSRMCICDQDGCAPGVCCTLKSHQGPQCNRPRPEPPPTGTCAAKCKGYGGVTIDDMPCCQEMLRKLAQDALALSNFTDLEKRVSIQEPEESDMTASSCVAKPVSCSPDSCKNGPISKTSSNCYTILPAPVPKKEPFCKDPKCLGVTKAVADDTNSSHQTTPLLQNHKCSMESCAKTVTNSTWTNTDSDLKVAEIKKSSTWTNTDSDIKVVGVDKASDMRGNDAQLSAMSSTAPLASKASSSIAHVSYIKLFGKMTKRMSSNSCCCKPIENKKGKKKSKNKKDKNYENAKNKPELQMSTCGHAKCAANTCNCRFPPAYGQFYDCSGQISGTCYCDETNTTKTKTE